MQGDSLAVVLFVWALAVAFFFEGRRETGWRLYLFWGFAGLLALSGLAWPEIASLWPAGKATLAAVAVNPTSWFFIIMFGMSTIALTGKTNVPVDTNSKEQLARIEKKLLRFETRLAESTQGQSTPLPTPSKAQQQPDWLTPLEAFEKFEPNESKKIRNWRSIRDRATQEVQEISKKLPTGRVGPNSVNVLIPPPPPTQQQIADKAKYDAAVVSQRNAADTYNMCLVARTELIRKRLERGDLRAQGFKEPRAGGEGVVDIPAEYWRLLKFVPGDLKFETVSGGGFTYIAIRIAKDQPN